MKDAYSFHASEKDAEDYYKQMIDAYNKIFSRCQIKTIMVEASSGSIGGSKSNEFMMGAKTGEDKIIVCEKCNWAANVEVAKERNCPKCNGPAKEKTAIEVGHIFQLGDKYSKTMGALFVDKDDKRKPIIMGCYGIGIGRLMAAIVEANFDDKGIIWPENIAPYKVYLIDLTNSSEGEKLYQQLQKEKIEVLFDDRDESAGVKFTDADLIGIPQRLVLSPKTIKNSEIEIKKRGEEKAKTIKIEDLLEKIKEQNES
jgi:prolyl-tRNA synthetase